MKSKNKETERKKILVVCQHFWPESFRINDICDFLVDKGCDIEVLCGIPNYPSGKFFGGYSYFRKRKQTHNGIEIRRAFEIPRGSNTNTRIFLNYMSFPVASLFHIPRLLTKKYDKIFVFTYSPIMMAIAGLIVGKIKKTEITLYALDLWPENLFSVIKVNNRFLHKIATAVSHWHYKKADKILAGSEKMKQQLLERSGIGEDKIIVLPQACEKIFEKQIHDKKLSMRFNRGFNVVFTGNMSPAQSLDTIVLTAKKLKDEGIKDINWIIVGDGMSRKDFEQSVKEAGLSKDFYFEGQKPQADIPRYTGIADVLVGGLVTSDLLEATLPAKVTSYIAAGKPMVMYLDGEARDLINNLAKSGYAGPTEDVNALAANIKKVYRLSDRERIAMGKRARDYHFKHLERNVIYNKLYDFIFDTK
jgi:glycosyltransferase involved in cell wall biosynthesis